MHRMRSSRFEIADANLLQYNCEAVSEPAKETHKTETVSTHVRDAQINGGG
jgi:hypothetical protein